MEYRAFYCFVNWSCPPVEIACRSELELSTGRNPGIVSIWDDEKARRRQKTDSSLIELPLSTESRSKQLTKKEENFLKVDVLSAR